MNVVQRRRVYQQRPNPPCTVIWMGSVCDLLGFGTVSQTAGCGLLEGSPITLKGLIESS
jgi:hypothetical protein